MRHKRDGLKSKVMDFDFPEDEKGKYVPYCGYVRHPGIVLDEHVCMVRNCSHYSRLYVLLNDPHGVYQK